MRGGVGGVSSFLAREEGRGGEGREEKREGRRGGRFRGPANPEANHQSTTRWPDRDAAPD